MSISSLSRTLVAASASSGRLRSGEGCVISSNPGLLQKSGRRKDQNDDQQQPGQGHFHSKVRRSMIESASTSALNQTDGTGQRSSFARMASAALVQMKGLGMELWSARSGIMACFTVSSEPET